MRPIVLYGKTHPRRLNSFLWRGSHDVSVHKRPLSTAAAAAKSGRPQSTLGTRLERQKRGIISFCARKKPASPFFLPLGQLLMWFLGRFGLKDFVPLPRVAGLPVYYRSIARSVP